MVYSTSVVILLCVSSCLCRPQSSAKEPGEGESLCSQLSKTKDFLALSGATVCKDFKKEEVPDSVHEFCIKSGNQIINDSLSKPDPSQFCKDKMKAMSVSAPMTQCFCTSLHVNFQSVSTTIDLMCKNKGSSEDQDLEVEENDDDEDREGKGGLGGAVEGAVLGIFLPTGSLLSLAGMNTDDKDKFQSDLALNWKVDYKTQDIDIKWDVENIGLRKQDIEGTVHALRDALKETYYPDYPDSKTTTKSSSTKSTSTKSSSSKSTRGGKITDYEAEFNASFQVSSNYMEAVQKELDGYKKQLYECQKRLQNIPYGSTPYEKVKYLCGYECNCDNNIKLFDTNTKSTTKTTSTTKNMKY